MKARCPKGDSQPARGSARILLDGTFETVAFARRRDRRRRQRELAKAARKKNR